MLQCLFATFEGGNEWFCVRSAFKGHLEAALTTSRSSIAPYSFLNNLNCILHTY